MRDPLLPPLAAIALGILASRFVSFGIRELIIVVLAFLTLGAIALWRRARVLAGACCLLGMVFARLMLPGNRICQKSGRFAGHPP